MSDLAYLGRSDPRFTPPGFTFITAPSPHLGGRGDIVAYVASGAKGARDLPGIVMLHGVCAGSWSWAFQGGAHIVLEEAVAEGRTPFVLIMASDGLRGDGTGYLPSVEANYERWITDTAISAARQAVPELGAASPLYVVGLSMGGYAAMRLSAVHPEVFDGTSAHSSVTTMADLASCIHHPLATLGLTTTDDELDLSHILTTQPALPPLRFDCGLDDSFLDSNRVLHRRLDEAGVPHDYAERPGAHSYDYWHRELRASLEFFDRLLADHRPG